MQFCCYLKLTIFQNGHLLSLICSILTESRIFDPDIMKSFMHDGDLKLLPQRGQYFTTVLHITVKHAMYLCVCIPYTQSVAVCVSVFVYSSRTANIDLCIVCTVTRCGSVRLMIGSGLCLSTLRVLVQVRTCLASLITSYWTYVSSCLQTSTCML